MLLCGLARGKESMFRTVEKIFSSTLSIKVPRRVFIDRGEVPDEDDPCRENL